MSGVIDARRSGARPAARSAGVWRAAWQRLRRDRVGMASLCVVGGYLVLVLATATGVLAADWGREVAVPYAHPTVLGPTPSESARIERPDGPMLDLGAFDPLAPKAREVLARLSPAQMK